MEVRPGYRQTEVGVIPEEWETRTCSELSERIMVGIVIRPAQYYVAHGVPALRSANIREDGITDTDLVFISDASNALLAKSQTQVGDVLTVRTGYPGTSAVVRPAHAGCNCIDILITRPSKKLDSDYLAVWVNSSFGKEQVLRSQGGLAQKHFNVGDMRNLVVALPPLPEQRAIATTLSDVDALLGGLDRLIAKKRDLKQAAMQQLLTGQTRLPGFHGEWSAAKIGELCEYEAGVATAGGEQGYVEIGDIDVVSKSYDIAGKEKPSVRGAVKVPAGTLLISTVRPTRGAIAITREEIYVSSAFCRLRPFNGLLFHLVCQGEFLAYLGENSFGGTYPTCRDETILSYECLLPGDPEEQSAIASVLCDMDAELAALEARRDKTRDLKQAMMQELLTGKTRLALTGSAHA
jgi:type I restriction enzyme S subunit